MNDPDQFRFDIRPSRFAQAAAALALCLLSAPSARAQECTPDTPVRPDDVAPTSCQEYAACPSAPIDVNHFGGAEVVSYPATPRDVGPCDTPGAYWPNRCVDPRATCMPNAAGNERCQIQFKGLMYRPAHPARTKPAVLLVPGSTDCSTFFPNSCVRQPEDFCGVAGALTAEGYVVMVALPRGYGLTPSIHSTGLYIDDLVTQQVGGPREGGVSIQDGCAIQHANDHPGAACSTFDLEDEGQFDVADGFAHLASRNFVNPDNMAILGHSLGGIRVLAFNTHDFGQKAAVAISPGSESWCLSDGAGNHTLWAELLGAVDAAKRPTYFLQPRNDVSLASGVELSHEAGLNRHQYETAIFPRVRVNGVPMQFGDEAHGCFVVSQPSVDVWAPSMLDFLGRYGVK